MNKPRFVWHCTPFDWFLFVFVGTAVIGTWISYDSERAAIKLGNIVASVLLYYILIGLRRRDMWAVSGLLGVLGSMIALYFLATHDWQAWPTDVDLLTRVGLFLMRIRPSFPFPAMHPNVAGGLIAVLLPFQAAFGLYIRRWKIRPFYGVTAVLFSITLLGFLLTSSRAAWLALAAASAFCVLWLIRQSRGIDGRLPRLIRYLLFTGLLFIMSAGLFILLTNHLPGVDSSASRLELFRHTLDLIADFPFTGGGLAAFPGLYSQYIAVTPFFQFNYSHNLWLDVALEQGMPGLLALIWIVVGSVWLLWRTITRPSRHQSLTENEQSHSFRRDLNLFRWAALIGLLTMAGHSLVDDALYGNLGTPLLFLLPGMAVVTANKHEMRRLQARSGWQFHAAWTGVAAALMIAPSMIAGRSLAADWSANRGALAMAQVELRGWPTGRWDNGRNAAQLTPAILLFQKAAESEPGNRTAQHRLGLAALLAQDFDTAVAHLQIANQLDPRHRGIIKALGYSYVWQGQLEKATVFLEDIPEFSREMKAYEHWWNQQGRPDLAAYAGEMIYE